MKLDLYIRLLDTYRAGPSSGARPTTEARPSNPLSRFHVTHEDSDDVWDAPYDLDLTQRNLSQAQKRAIHVRTLNEAYAEGTSGQIWQPESLSAQVERDPLFTTKNFDEFFKNLTRDASKLVNAHSSLDRHSAIRLLMSEQGSRTG